MSPDVNKKLFISGVTNAGKKFRPSDWAERLCCSVSCFRPDYPIRQRNIYSPYATPVVISGVPYVIVDEAIGKINPMALDFLVSFAKDNDLPILEACPLPDDF